MKTAKSCGSRKNRRLSPHCISKSKPKEKLKWIKLHVDLEQERQKAKVTLITPAAGTSATSRKTGITKRRPLCRNAAATSQPGPELEARLITLVMDNLTDLTGSLQIVSANAGN